MAMNEVILITTFKLKKDPIQQNDHVRIMSLMEQNFKSDTK